MRQRADMDFDTAMEIVRLVRIFRAVLAAHALKYRTIEALGRSRHSLQMPNVTGFAMQRNLRAFGTRA